MKNFYTLKSEAEKEAYEYFDKKIRNLIKNKNGEINNTASDLVDNDVDAFRHSYVSGRYTQEYGKTAAKILGDLQEFFPGGSSDPQSSELAKNMDRWNNTVGRRYGGEVKSRHELAVLLQRALENGELIVSLEDLREFGEETIFYFDSNKPIIVLKESETGRNELFCDLSNGTVFDRKSLASAIESGEYPGYLVASIDGLATPMTKPDGIASNNLG